MHPHINLNLKPNLNLNLNMNLNFAGEADAFLSCVRASTENYEFSLATT